jgi:hypothetical protein
MAPSARRELALAGAGRRPGAAAPQLQDFGLQPGEKRAGCGFERLPLTALNAVTGEGVRLHARARVACGRR